LEVGTLNEAIPKAINHCLIGKGSMKNLGRLPPATLRCGNRSFWERHYWQSTNHDSNT